MGIQGTSKNIEIWFVFLEIKIISYAFIAFFTGRQTFCIRVSNIFLDSTWTKACDTAVDLIDLAGNMHSFMLPLSRRYIKTSVVSQCRVLVPVQYMNTQLFTFFWTDNSDLHLLHCSVTWSLLTLTDVDWTYWLAVDVQVRKHKHWINDLKLTQSAATLYISCTLPTNSTLTIVVTKRRHSLIQTLASVLPVRDYWGRHLLISHEIISAGNLPWAPTFWKQLFEAHSNHCRSGLF